MDRPYDHNSRPPHLEPFHYANSPSSSPAPPAAMLGRRLGRVGRRLERTCCLCATYFPVAFVYSLSTWSVWVTTRLCTLPASSPLVAASYNDSWRGPWCAVVAAVLMVLQLWSYTVAVVTSPGSTTNDHGYSTLPLHAPHETGPTAAASSLTVKSNGGLRFCKKCQARKPDRAHHCSSCRRCVLKMDHHCPWLANCIGLRNAKAFLLFLVYTTLLGLFCFAVSGSWVWNEISDEATYTDAGGGIESAFLPVQIIIMCVVAGIIGLVVGLFTAWHIVLACRGQTTIECMEKTRYQALGASAASAHRSSATSAVATVANTLNNGFASSGRQARDEEQGFLFDGVEGAHDDHDSNSSRGNDRRLTYDDLERYRAQKRHEAYLEYEDSEKLPHAFDLGVRRNLLHLFGPRLWLWPFPVYTTTGDGWSWTPGPKWLAARERLDKERAAQAAREHAAGWGHGPVEPYPQPSPPIVVTTHAAGSPAAAKSGNSNSNSNSNMPSRYRQAPGRPLGSPSKADRVLGRNSNLAYADGASLPNRSGSMHPGKDEVSMQRLSVVGRTRHGEEDLFTDDDDDDDDDDYDGLDNAEAEEKSVPGRGALPPPPSSQQQQRPLSPLRARWMPNPTSGLVRTASATGGSSLSPTSMAQDNGSSAAIVGKEEDEVD